MKYIIIVIAMILGITGLFNSCKDAATNSISDIDKIVFPDSNISYYRTIQPLFNIGCATNGCHDMASHVSNLDLSDYLGLTQRFYDGVVKKNDPENSKLIWRIEGQFGLQPMPPQRPLSANQIRGFKQWIREGATDKN